MDLDLVEIESRLRQIGDPGEWENAVLGFTVYPATEADREFISKAPAYLRACVEEIRRYREIAGSADALCRAYGIPSGYSLWDSIQTMASMARDAGPLRKQVENRDAEIERLQALVTASGCDGRKHGP